MSIECYNAYAKNKGVLLSKYITTVVLISAVQNIYLGIFIDRLEKVELQIALSTHVLFIIFTLVLLLLMTKDINWFGKLLMIMMTYVIIEFIINSPKIVPFIASLRNLISPVIIFLFSMSLGKKADEKNIYKELERILVFVILFGIIEYLIGNSFWIRLNVTELWTKKNIIPNPLTKVPKNWYSSEIIGGHQLRRMVSSFADPVNLGTFLFAGFVLAWHEKKKMLAFVSLICIILCMSKGAFLGLLVFFVVFFWYTDRSKLSIPMVVGIVLGIGIAFINFSRGSSTGSMAFHFNNFLNSFRLLASRPFGFGIGSAGVLSGISGGNLLTNVTETGFGAIVAQLGFVGLIIYIAFYCKIFVGNHGLNSRNRNDKIMYYSLLYAYIANTLFNEVALSPNSCGIYFIILGVMYGKSGYKDNLQSKRCCA